MTAGAGKSGLSAGGSLQEGQGTDYHQYFDTNPLCEESLATSCRSRSESPQLPSCESQSLLTVNGNSPDSPGSPSRNGSPSPETSPHSPDSLSSEDVGGGKRKRFPGSYNVKRSRKKSEAEEPSLKIVFSKVRCV